MTASPLCESEGGGQNGEAPPSGRTSGASDLSVKGTHAMTADRICLQTPAGKPVWLVYGVRRICDGAVIYIGRTIKPLWLRWAMHGVTAGYERRMEKWKTPLLAAIRDNGLFAFQPEELACCLSERDAAWVEDRLITAYDTLHPNGFNSAPAIKGGKRSAGFTARLSEQTRAVFVQMSDARREERAEISRHNGRGVLKVLNKMGVGSRRAWADPDKRPARLEQLTLARRRCNLKGKKQARIKDARQKDLL